MLGSAGFCLKKIDGLVWWGWMDREVGRWVGEGMGMGMGMGIGEGGVFFFISSFVSSDKQ